MPFRAVVGVVHASNDGKILTAGGESTVQVRMVKMRVNEIDAVIPNESAQGRDHTAIMASTLHERERNHRYPQRFRFVREFSAVLDAADHGFKFSRIQISQYAKKHALRTAYGQSRDEMEYAYGGHAVVSRTAWTPA